MTSGLHRARHRTAAAIAITALAGSGIVVGGCGSSDSAPASSTGDEQATVLAAASLTDVLPRIAPNARFSFGGSDQLAFQIEQGAPADVLASASPKYTQALFAKGTVQRPRAFATNSVVMIVPRTGGAGITSLRQVTRPGVKVVMGAPGVPAGDYARAALTRLGLSGALGNVVSQEPDVKGVLAKVAYGEADAGFVYATDARAAGGRVRAFRFPRAAGADARYEVAVVTNAPHPQAAEAFVQRLTSATGRQALEQAGFGVPAP